MALLCNYSVPFHPEHLQHLPKNKAWIVPGKAKEQQQPWDLAMSWDKLGLVRLGLVSPDSGFIHKIPSAAARDGASSLRL